VVTGSSPEPSEPEYDLEVEEEFEVEPVPAVGSGQAPVSRDTDEEAQPEDTPTKMLVGPIRSGCVLEAPGHLIIVGDINPGAEVRAKGCIVVLGRLRGIAHAAHDGGSGFIVALSLSPQQLRVGSLVARAGDAESPGSETEIAYASDGRIIVETFSGKLPFGIATAKL